MRTFWSSARRPALALAVSLLALGPVARAQQPPNARESLGRLKAGNDRFVKNASTPVALSPPTRQPLAKAQTPFADRAVVRRLARAARIRLQHRPGRSVRRFARRRGRRSVGHGQPRIRRRAPAHSAARRDGSRVLRRGQGRRGQAPVEGPNLQFLVNAIRAGTGRTPPEQQELRTAVLANIEQVINDALAGSQILRHAVDSGQVLIVGAYYELGSGRVVFSEPASTTTAVHQ